jgi:hypothetical protein
MNGHSGCGSATRSEECARQQAKGMGATLASPPGGGETFGALRMDENPAEVEFQLAQSFGTDTLSGNGPHNQTKPA